MLLYVVSLFRPWEVIATLRRLVFASSAYKVESGRKTRLQHALYTKADPHLYNF